VTKLAFGAEPSDRAFRLRLARYPALAAALAEFLRETQTAPDARTPRILDVGCGRGRTLRYLEREFPGGAVPARLVGVDLDPRLPERLHRFEAWTALLADASLGLPFADGAFDAVVCEQVMEHMEDPAALVREAARVLRPGGLFVAGVPTFPPGAGFVRGLFAHRHDDAHHGHGHVQTFSAPSFRRLVAAGPFDVVSVRGFRSASGGVLSPLEDHRWWWRFNGAVFGRLTWFAAEVQLVARRRVARS
jgi:SAM-dependent methyltransferase